MMNELMESASLWTVRLTACAACALLVAAAVSDLRTRRVTNAIPLLLLGLFAVHAAAGAVSPAISLWKHFAVAAVLLAAGFALYSTGRFGGADAKLIAVAGLWAGPNDLAVFLIGLGACALMLSVCALLPYEGPRRLRSDLPFAVAIVPPGLAVIAPHALSHGAQSPPL